MANLDSIAIEEATEKDLKQQNDKVGLFSTLTMI